MFCSVPSNLFCMKWCGTNFCNSNVYEVKIMLWPCVYLCLSGPQLYHCLCRLQRQERHKLDPRPLCDKILPQVRILVSVWKYDQNIRKTLNGIRVKINYSPFCWEALQKPLGLTENHSARWRNPWISGIIQDMHQTITDKDYKANQNAKNLPYCLFKTQKNIHFCPCFLEMSVLHCGWHQPWKFSVHPVQDTPDVTFLSLLRKHPTFHWPDLMVFRWYQGSRGVLSAQDPNETWAEIVAWRPIGALWPIFDVEP